MVLAGREELPPLDPWEKGKSLPRFWVTGAEMPWWFALLLTGDSAPLAERRIQEAKRDWNEEDADGAIAEMRAQFAELQASTLDNFVRLTILGAIVAAVIALNQHAATFILSKTAHLPCKVASCSAIVLAGAAMVCILVMVVPKYKEWRRFKPADRDDAGMHVLKSRREKGWPEFLRLMHRYAHRKQLITFERRVKNLGCLLIIAAYVSWAVALILA